MNNIFKLTFWMIAIVLVIGMTTINYYISEQIAYHLLLRYNLPHIWGKIIKTTYIAFPVIIFFGYLFYKKRQDE